MNVFELNRRATVFTEDEILNAVMIFHSRNLAITGFDSGTFKLKPENWPQPKKAILKNILEFVLYRCGMDAIQNPQVPVRYWESRQDYRVWLRGLI